ncbi:hypothetical protein HDV00_008459 [Rhizophlyctis rosea]|nr:hypothetical protein HDV00_008459 [Rhizophlyctis rosea]
MEAIDSGLMSEVKAGRHVVEGLRESARSLSCPAGLLSSTLDHEPAVFALPKHKVESWTMEDETSDEDSATSEAEPDMDKATQSVTTEVDVSDVANSTDAPDKESPISLSRFSKILRKVPTTDAANELTPFDVLSTSNDEHSKLHLDNVSKKPRMAVMAHLQPPMDWTVKTSATFTSDVSFEWCSQQNSAEDSANLISFVAQCKSENRQTSLRHCLYHWTYPIEIPSPIRVSTITKILGKVADKAVLEPEQDLEYKTFLQSEEAWKRAFQSLYHITRNGQSPYFYYLNSEFSVLFFGESATKGMDCEAIMSKSSPGIRKQLENDDIDFREVRRGKRSTHSAEVVEQEEEELGLPEDKEFVDAQKAPARMQQQEGGSALHFVGHNNVHGLFDFLLNWKEPRIERRAEKFPMLLAPSPFLNGCLRTAESAMPPAEIRGQIQSRSDIHFALRDTYYQPLSHR